MLTKPEIQDQGMEKSVRWYHEVFLSKIVDQEYFFKYKEWQVGSKNKNKNLLV